MIPIEEINANLSKADNELNDLQNKYPGLAGGISDTGRMTDEYKSAKSDFNKYFSMLRQYNQKNKSKRKGYNIVK